MKRTKAILSSLIVIGVIAVGLTGFCQSTGRADVNKLIVQLRSSSEIDRANAALALGIMGAQATRAIPDLVKMLSDDRKVRVTRPKVGVGYVSPGVRSLGEIAAAALAKIGKPAVVPLIATLGNRDFFVRQKAAITLGKIGDPRATKPLLRALGKDIGYDAANALGKIKDPGMVEPLISALKDGNPKVRKDAANALGQTKDPRAVDPLTIALKDQNESVRVWAAIGLGWTKDPRAVEPLIKALRDPSPRVRKNAAYYLGRMKDSRAVKPLIVALKDEDEKVQKQAAVGLGEIKDPRGVEPLIAALNDRKVKKWAAYALGMMEEPRAVERLIRTLKDRDKDIRRIAAEALSKITGEDFGQSYGDWRKWWKKNKDSFQSSETRTALKPQKRQPNNLKYKILYFEGLYHLGSNLKSDALIRELNFVQLRSHYSKIIGYINKRHLDDKNDKIFFDTAKHYFDLIGKLRNYGFNVEIYQHLRPDGNLDFNPWYDDKAARRHHIYMSFMTLLNGPYGRFVNWSLENDSDFSSREKPKIDARRQPIMLLSKVYEYRIYSKKYKIFDYKNGEEFHQYLFSTPCAACEAFVRIQDEKRAVLKLFKEAFPEKFSEN